MQRIMGFAVAVALVLGLSGEVGAAGYKVVVNKDNPAPGLVRQKVAFMFMGMTAKWEHGVAVAAIDQLPGAAVRVAFTREIHNRDVADIQTAWQRAVFSGRGEPPPEAASDADVLSYVASHPGGIGYVSEAAATDGVKVLGVLR